MSSSSSVVKGEKEEKEGKEKKKESILPYIIVFAVLFIILLVILTFMLDTYNKSHYCRTNPNIYCLDDWYCQNGTTGPCAPLAIQPTGYASCLFGPTSANASVCYGPTDGTGTACDCGILSGNNCLLNCPPTLSQTTGQCGCQGTQCPS